MKSLKDAVIPQPKFEKIATIELSKNINDWNETILKAFYEEINYLPKEIGVNVIITNIDENKGYAKGSIVVFFNGKQINFPVIVNDYKLSPFDVFIYKVEGKDVYYPANEINIKKVLMADQVATLENRWDQARGYQLVKAPGGVQPKQSINLYDAPEESLYPPFAKMSNWHMLAKKEDLEKFAETLVGMPDVSSAFHDNTGDLATNLVQLKSYQREEVTPNEHRKGVIDLNGVIDSKRAITTIDSDMFDVSSLIPLQPPCVAEARIYQYPSMEDFLESGENMAERFIASKMGKPVIGILLDLVDKERITNLSVCTPDIPKSDTQTPEQKLKEVRARRDQVFLSLCGKFYSTFDDYDKTGIGFYGSKMMNTPEAVEKAVKMLSLVTTDDFINVNPNNRNDGSDKLFAGFNTMEQGKDRHGDGGKYIENNSYIDDWNQGLFVIYGAGTSYECVEFKGNFKKYMVQNSHVYSSRENVIIPANVASIQKVCKVKDPMYKMIVGNTPNIYLFPEGALIVNKGFMKPFNKSDFMRPDLPVQKMYEEQNISKIALWVSSNGKEVGYHIEGKAFEPMKKLAGINNGKILTTAETRAALNVMGMDKTSSDRAMTVAFQKFANYNEKNKNVFIYGVRDDYVKFDLVKDMEKQARVTSVLKEIAYSLRRDLIKEASILTDPKTVDVILSLNFINEESISNYIENINAMKDVLANLSQLLVASRMGLSEIDETACKNSIKGLSDVINGLENLKMSMA